MPSWISQIVFAREIRQTHLITLCRGMDIGSTTLDPSKGDPKTSENPLAISPTANLRRPQGQSDLLTSSSHLFSGLCPDMVLIPLPGTACLSLVHLPWEDLNSQHVLQAKHWLFREKVHRIWICRLVHRCRRPLQYTPRTRVRKEEQQASPRPGPPFVLASAPWRVDKGLEMNQQVCPTPQEPGPSQAHVPSSIATRGSQRLDKLRNKNVWLESHQITGVNRKTFVKYKWS